MKRISSVIIINASAQRIWNVITDFNSYPLWNTFTPRITLTNDRCGVGAEFDLDCRMTERLLFIDEHETILSLEPDRFRFCMGTSRTKGRPGIRSFRWQICEPLEAGRTRFTNFEEFHGPLAPLVYLLYAKRLKKAFERYCAELKAYAETRKD
jgi:hypothetical protein